MVFAVYASPRCGGPGLGPVSDVVGRKPVILGAFATMILGLVAFLLADSVPMLLLARALHGAAVGATSSRAPAALLDLRPERGARSGQLSGVAFNVGIAVAVLGTAVLAQYAPSPLRTPYVVIAVVCLAAGAGILALREPHTTRVKARITIAKPSVPQEIKADFWFSAIGVMAAWSVLGVLLSLYPSLAAAETGMHNLVFGGVVVAGTALVAAVVQLFATRVPARRAAVIGDLGMAAALLATIPALATKQPAVVVLAGLVLGATFGLGFGGSLRHLSEVVPPHRRGETMRPSTCWPTRRWRCRRWRRAGRRRPGGSRRCSRGHRDRFGGLCRCRAVGSARDPGRREIGVEHRPVPRESGPACVVTRASRRTER